jgi:hypothetical protein
MAKTHTQEQRSLQSPQVSDPAQAHDLVTPPTPTIHLTDHTNPEKRLDTPHQVDKITSNY